MKEDNLLLTESIKRYRWKVGPWNDCSKPCNIGTKRRAVACYDTRGNKAMLSEWICKRISRKPKDQMPCNRKPCQLLKPETNGQWIKGEWSKCSVTCDKVIFSLNFMGFGFYIGIPQFTVYFRSAMCEFNTICNCAWNTQNSSKQKVGIVALQSIVYNSTLLWGVCLQYFVYTIV